MGFDGDPQVNEHHDLDTIIDLDGVLARVSDWLATSNG